MTFQKGQKPPQHKKGCACFRCTKIPPFTWKNKKQPQEMVEKRRLKLLGHVCSEETREKISKANQGQNLGRIPWNKNTKGVMKAWNKGKPHYHIAGSNHHNWKGGITPLNSKLRSSSQWKYWRKDVFERDNYTCQDCNTKGCLLHPHHIIPVKECLQLDFQEMIFNVDNGLTLCYDCHLNKELHKKYNRGDSNFINK